MKNKLLKILNKLFFRRSDCKDCYYLSYCDNSYYGWKGQCKSFKEK